MKVLIVNPSRFFSGNWGQSELNHLFTLYSYVRNHCPGVEVDVLDLERELFTPDSETDVMRFMAFARAALAATGFDVVGISCWTSMHYLSTVAIAEACKELNPECTVVVGGYHPSSLPQDFDYPGTPFDYVVTGEGEVAFKRIIDGEIPRERRPQLVVGTPVEFDDERLLWEEYKYHRNPEFVQMWLTRGCPFSCGFCLDRLSRWRGYSPARAVGEIKRLRQMFPALRQVHLMDPIFGLNKTWRREFMDGLLEADLGLGYWGETRADIMEEEDIRRMGALGFHMDIGVDSVSPRMIGIMMKSKHPDKYVQSFLATDELMNRYKVPHLVYTILNYPGETSATLDETQAFWTKYYHEHPDTFAWLSAQSFKFFPGCEVFNNFASYTERFGSRVLHPQWWKLHRPTYLGISGEVVPSRELAEAGKLLHYNVVRQAIEAAGRGALHETMRDIVAETWKVRHAYLAASPAFYARRRVRVQEDTDLHRRLTGQALLFNFASGSGYLCSPQETRWLDALLQEGLTIGGLGDREAAYAVDPRQPRLKVQQFCRQMLVHQFLRIDISPPAEELPAGTRYDAVVHTDLGQMTFRLLPEEAPRAVANFVRVARAGYYDDLGIQYSFPGAYMGSGDYLQGMSPPYQLPAERTPRRNDRGTLSMSIHIHGTRYAIARRPWPELDEKSTVIGELTSGEDVLDRLLKLDVVQRIEIVETPP